MRSLVSLLLRLVQAVLRLWRKGMDLTAPFRQQVLARLAEMRRLWVATPVGAASAVLWSWGRNSLLVRIGVHLGVFAVSALVMISSMAYLYFNPRIPLADSLLEVQLQTPMRVYTRDGSLIGEFGEQKRRPISYDELPPQLIQAFLAAEDDGFFEHSGVDIPALTRAFAQLIFSGGEIRSGGGTITMQVARNYLLSRDRTFYRKFREILLALKLEERFSKQKLMEFYVNGVFFGNRAYGVEAASQTYFGRDPVDLTLPEMALLVSLPKAPSRLNPFRAPLLAKIRRNWVLRRMKSIGYIGQEQYQEAVDWPIWLSEGGNLTELNARFAAEMARIELVEKFGRGLYSGGFHVYTTIDSRMQKAALQALQDGLTTHDQRHGWRQPVSLQELFSDTSREQFQERNLTDFVQIGKSSLSSGELSGRDDILAVLDALGGYPVLGDNRPAVVLLVDRATLWVFTPDARVQEVKWKPGALLWARPRRDQDDPDNLGYPPRSFESLFQMGDVVYLRYEEDEPQGIVQLPQTEGAVVSLDSQTGAVRSMVGGYHFRRSKFNRAVQADLQPGSVFKPFLYAVALRNGDTPASIYDDAPVVFEDLQLEDVWRPQNSTGQFFGPTRLRDALVHSLNMVSIRMLEAWGVEKVHQYLSEMFGFPVDQMQKNLSLALGSAGLSPLEIATAYATLANGGYRVDPWLISHITDSRGRVVWRQVPVVAPGSPPVQSRFGSVGDANADLDQRPLPPEGSSEEAERVLDGRIAYQITDMLREVMVRGTAGGATQVLQRQDFAGKTGTTNDAEDAWFSGYNANFVSVVWVGHDQPRTLGASEFGATVAMPIWINYIKEVSSLIPVAAPLRPSGLIAVRINPQTGRRANSSDYTAIFEIFRREKVPGADLSGADESPEDIF